MHAHVYRHKDTPTSRHPDIQTSRHPDILTLQTYRHSHTDIRIAGNTHTYRQHADIQTYRCTYMHLCRRTDIANIQACRHTYTCNYRTALGLFLLRAHLLALDQDDRMVAFFHAMKLDISEVYRYHNVTIHDATAANLCMHIYIYIHICIYMYIYI